VTYRVRGTAGGNLIVYTGDKSALTAADTTVKLLINATVSSADEFSTAYITDFYLNTKLPSPEWMRV
jgi:hypothetical protein